MTGLFLLLLPGGLALILALGSVFWSLHTLSKASKLGWSAVLAQILLGSIVVMLTAKVYSFIPFNNSCQGHAFGCLGEISYVIKGFLEVVLLGFVPYGFPIIGEIICAKWSRNSKR